MKYYIKHGNLIGVIPHEQEEAKKLAIKIKKASPKVKVQIIPESEVFTNDKNVLSNDDKR